MAHFLDDFNRATEEHRQLFVLLGLVGLGLGLAFRDTTRPPEELAGVMIFLGSLVTLFLCTRLLGDAFRQPTLEPAHPTLQAQYGYQLGLTLAVAGVSRGVAAISLAPSYLLISPGTVAAQLLMGLPLDALLIAVTLSLSAMLGRGGAVLAFAVVFLGGAVGHEAAVSPGYFGGMTGVLTVTRFPWLELQALSTTTSPGGVAGALVDSLRLVTYFAAWSALGIGALRYRAGRNREGPTPPRPPGA